MFCGAVQADAIASDIVGYQSKGLDNGDFNWTCPSFKMVGDKTMTLGDLKVNENYFASVLQFTDAGGATKKFTLPLKGEDPNVNPTGEEVYGEFEYWALDWFDGETIVNADGYAAGWYLRDSSDNLYLMDALKIPAGSGFMIDCGDDDAQVVIPSAL